MRKVIAIAAASLALGAASASGAMLMRVGQSAPESSAYANSSREISGALLRRTKAKSIRIFSQGTVTTVAGTKANPEISGSWHITCFRRDRFQYWSRSSSFGYYDDPMIRLPVWPIDYCSFTLGGSASYYADYPDEVASLVFSITASTWRSR